MITYNEKDPKAYNLFMLAKRIIKDEMKRQGIRLSDVPTKEITAAAKALVKECGDIYK